MRLIAALFLSLLPAMVFAAAPEPQDKYISHCHVTPEVTPKDPYPGKAAIVSSNKLALPAGKAVYAKGELVALSGRVFDENCVPVSDAIVEIWQTDPSGKYGTSSLSERMDPYPHFTGSGRAVTDNLGRFNFMTLFPGPYGKRAPHIHVHVIHANFHTVDTEMFFGDDKRNDSDPKLNHLAAKNRPLVMAKTWQRDAGKAEEGLVAEWDITLKGKNQFRHF